ncbi:hypothetical protein JW968_01780 [Candidatus Woesearchaeota archaeon]|nr:hypothetical protein [Candidatus Woesearchaeota archaeon]
MGIISITPDKERCRSIMRMAETSLNMINEIDHLKYPSNVIKEYYEIIRELLSVIMLLEGKKAVGEEAHKRLIEHIRSMNIFPENEIQMIDDLRILRNRIAYEGFFIRPDYLERNHPMIKQIINRQNEIIQKQI